MLPFFLLKESNKQKLLWEVLQYDFEKEGTRGVCSISPLSLLFISEVMFLGLPAG